MILDRAVERIRLTRHKVSAYSEYLSEEKERLEESLAQMDVELRSKVGELSAAD